MALIDPGFNLVARRHRAAPLGYGWPLQFSRASVASYWDASGVMRFAASGALRHDCDPLTGQYLGWLIEEARTNLLIRVEEFDNAAWTKLNATVPVTNIADPAGGTNGDELREDGATGVHIVFQSASGTASARHAWSVYAKATASPRRFILDLDDGIGNGVRATFDVSAGSVSSVTTTGAGSAAEARIKARANGWYRCVVIGIPNSGGGSTVRGLVRMINGASADNYAGDNASGVYLWGAQLEAGAMETSYIATAASQVTRLADVLDVAVSRFVHNAAEGSVLVIGRGPVTEAAASGVYQTSIDLSTDSANRLMTIYRGVGAATVHAVSINGGVSQADMTPGSIAALTRYAIAAAYKPNDFAAAQDGGSVTNDTSASVAAATTLAIGRDKAGGDIGYANSWIEMVQIFPRRLTDTDLQSLTL